MKLLIALLLTSIAATAEKAPQHTFRILFLEAPETAPKSLHLFDGIDSREVELPRMNFSKVYELRSGDLTLALLPTPLSDPKQLPVGAPSIKVPAGVVDFYLLIVSDPANKIAPVAMRLINSNHDRLKRGQILWLNLTANTVGGLVGSGKLVVKPQSLTILDPPAADLTNYPVSLSFRIPGDERTYSLCETQWFHDQRRRSVAFIISKPDTRTPRVMVFPDYREAGKEEDQ